MCDRYFVVFPNKALPDHVVILNKALKNVKSEDVKLHPEAFFKPIYPRKKEAKRYTVATKQNKDHILRQNVSDIAKRTRNLGMLLTQCHWNGLLTLEQGRIIMTQTDDTLKAISMYRMLLKKDAQMFQKFINALHMTGNHEIANLIEACQHRRVVEEKCFKKAVTTKQKKSTLSSVSEDVHQDNIDSTTNPTDGEMQTCEDDAEVPKDSESECSAYREEKSKPSQFPLGYRSRHASYHTHEKMSFIRIKKESHCRKKAHAHQKENKFSNFFGLFQS